MDAAEAMPVGGGEVSEDAHPDRPMMMVKAPVRALRGPIESFMLIVSLAFGSEDY
jgi:hypothetical protein